MKQELKVGVKVLGNELVLPMSYKELDKSGFAKNIITKNDMYFNDYILSDEQNISLKELNKILLNLNDILLHSEIDENSSLEIIFNQIKNILGEITFKNLYYVKFMIDTTQITKSENDYNFCDEQLKYLFSQIDNDEAIEFLKNQLSNLSYEKFYKNLEHVLFINYDYDNDCYVSTPKIILEDKTKSLKKDDFFYGGYCFSPYKTLRFKKLNKTLSSRLETDNDLGLCNYEWRKRDYNYDAFYEAANHSKCDLFLCKDNDKIYAPSNNELFLYKI